jgi:hypothetical protein
MKHESWNNRQGFDASAVPECEADRFTILLETQLVAHDGEAVKVVIRDISSTGFMGECDSFVRIGSVVSVALPGTGPDTVHVDATIIWALAGRLGGKFSTLVNIEELAEKFRC